MIHIDWLSISQIHPNAPEWGATRRIDIDMDTGEIDLERILGDTVQASWDTSLRVRSTGGRVEVSGNPSKWGRLDAVVGIADLWSCIDVYNGVLDAIGLPTFKRAVRQRSEEGEHHETESGARISRIDLTRNLVLGRGGVAFFLDWLEAQKWGHRLSFRRTADTMVAAGSRDRRQRVSYDKGKELRDNMSKWRRSRSLDRERAVAYLIRLAAWADSIGLARDEMRLGTKWFSGSAYRYADNWKPDTAEKLFKAQEEIQTLEAGAMQDYRSGIYETLVAKGYSERMAGQLQKIVHAWLHGDEWKLGLKKSAAYKYAAILRKECGFDISKRSNVRSLAVCVKPKVLEARPLTREDLPDWYDRPNLKLVA